MSKSYTVKQLNAYIKNMFTSDFLLSKVSVTGEVSNYKDHPSGHIYFTLRDEGATLSVVMFSGNRLRGLKCRLKEGLKVTVTGAVSVYEAGGRYQLYAKEIEEVGEGDLYRQFEELKTRLQEMGMFDPSFKKPIPEYVRTLGIVTSDSGAALHDIVTVSRRRFPGIQLVLSPCLVQGEAAPGSIVRALEKMDAFGPDVIILGRGGGSLEDLWCFNDERVARAVFDCDTPVISAVGHEVDFTITDFVADLRAATPSAAAELAIFDQEALLQQYAYLEGRMRRTFSDKLNRVQGDLEQLSLKLDRLHPAMKLMEKSFYLQDLYDRMEQDMERMLQQRKQRFSLLAERLDAGSPLKKLSGGYGYISLEGKALKNAADAAPGDLLKIVLHDGQLSAEVQ
ncbi:MAG: exodeoxyribonuclease VII large subunit [Lachnospiraceae bacterium]|nr:exodeoxyribonuclease VII large subunit [Lachnospiraceae bacterium]